MEKLLVTGITGFVGQNLKKYTEISSLYNLIGISRKADGESVKSYCALTPEFWNQTTAFIHLAGKAHDLKKTTEEKDYFEANTELTKKVFKQFLESNCEVFVYMSSVKAVADTVEDILTEETQPIPKTAYGKSKLAAEKYLLSQEPSKGKRVYILRPCMIHGPGNKGNLNLLYHFVKKGIPYPFGSFENKRSFVSIDNLCFVIKELIENKKIPSGVYNISDDQALSTSELVKTMGEVLQKPAKIFKTPKLLVRGISKIGDLFPLPVNSERLQKLTENYVVSNRKIVKVMGKELPFTAREGLRKTIGSFGKNI